MTSKELAKLETIIGKLEYLQNALSNPNQKEVDALRRAKRALMDIRK